MAEINFQGMVDEISAKRDALTLVLEQLQSIQTLFGAAPAAQQRRAVRGAAAKRGRIKRHRKRTDGRTDGRSNNRAKASRAEPP